MPCGDRETKITSLRNQALTLNASSYLKGKQVMSLEKALQTSMATIPECLASGYVDLGTGMLLGVHTADSHPQEILDTLAAATADLFQGASVVQIEDMFKQARGTESDAHYFNEIVVFSENLLHAFMRTKAYPDHVLCFVCRKNANPGMVLTKSRDGCRNSCESPVKHAQSDQCLGPAFRIGPRKLLKVQ